MNRFLKILDPLIIVGTCVASGIAISTRSVDPWWIFLIWIFVVVISRIQIIMMTKIINKYLESGELKGEVVTLYGLPIHLSLLGKS